VADPLNPNPAYPAGPLAGGASLTMPIVIYALYIVALFTGGLSMLLGVVLAYVLRGEAGPAARTHYTFLIRTFWGGAVLIVLGVAMIMVGVPLLIVLVGLPIIIVGALLASVAHIWQLVRCVFGLYHAANGRPYPEPLTPLV
jgi:uncharacterized membrane protein